MDTMIKTSSFFLGTRLVQKHGWLKNKKHTLHGYVKTDMCVYITLETLLYRKWVTKRRDVKESPPKLFPVLEAGVLGVNF